MGRCCRQWKCAIAFCNQQKKVKNFHFYYFFSCAHNREGKNSFPVLFTRSMKVTRFFLRSWSSTLFIVVQSIKQHVCRCKRLIWKCAIAHWSHVVLAPFKRSPLEPRSHEFLMLSIRDQITWRLSMKFPLSLLQVIKLWVLFASFPLNSSPFPFCINLKQPECFLFPQVFLSCLLL